MRCALLLFACVHASGVRSAGAMRFSLDGLKGFTHLDSNITAPSTCTCLAVSDLSEVSASNYTTRFAFTKAAPKKSGGFFGGFGAKPESAKHYSGSGAFVNQSLYQIELPMLREAWTAQQEKCVGPDRPSRIESKRDGSPWHPERVKRRASIPANGAGFLNFIHAGLKETSVQPYPAAFTYALVVHDDGTGYLNMAEEGDHMVPALVAAGMPHLRKYDGREDTKHKKLSTGDLLYAGQMFVDLGVPLESFDWEQVAGDAAEMFSGATVVIDDGSGTYKPSPSNLPTLACILRAYFPGLRVVAQTYRNTSASEAATSMGLQLEADNAVKWSSRSESAVWTHPYKIKFRIAVDPSLDQTAFVDADPRHCAFPSSWGRVTAVRVRIDGLEFSVTTADRNFIGKRASLAKQGEITWYESLESGSKMVEVAAWQYTGTSSRAIRTSPENADLLMRSETISARNVDDP